MPCDNDAEDGLPVIRMRGWMAVPMTPSSSQGPQRHEEKEDRSAPNIQMNQYGSSCDRNFSSPQARPYRLPAVAGRPTKARWGSGRRNAYSNAKQARLSPIYHLLGSSRRVTIEGGAYPPPKRTKWARRRRRRAGAPSATGRPACRQRPARSARRRQGLGNAGRTVVPAPRTGRRGGAVGRHQGNGERARSRRAHGNAAGGRCGGRAVGQRRGGRAADHRRSGRATVGGGAGPGRVRAPPARAAGGRGAVGAPPRKDNSWCPTTRSRLCRVVARQLPGEPPLWMDRSAACSAPQSLSASSTIHRQLHRFIIWKREVTRLKGSSTRTASFKL